jgi:hypothetical protein
MPAERDGGERAMFIMGANEFGGEALETGICGFVLCRRVCAGGEEENGNGCGR